MALNQFLGSEQDLSALVQNIIRVGEVTSVNPQEATARVRFQDRDDIESYDLQIVTRNSQKNKDYWTPDVGENVLCLFLPVGVEAGFIIGAYYPQPVARPAASIDVDARTYEDGTRFEYDRAQHRFLLDLGPTKIIADRTMLKLESNGTTLQLDSSGWKLKGTRGDLN